MPTEWMVQVTLTNEECPYLEVFENCEKTDKDCSYKGCLYRLPMTEEEMKNDGKIDEMRF